MSRRKEDESGRRIKGRGAESRTVRSSYCIQHLLTATNSAFTCSDVALSSHNSRKPLVAVQQVCVCSGYHCMTLTPFADYEALPDSGSGAGPQRSVEGWVIFVTGIYEETQVPALQIACGIDF
jgi:hypothetical protein